MKIEQFFDTGLAHSSYAILSDNKIALIDPARNPQPYYDFAEQHNAKIIAVIETHPHADFVSSHCEIHRNAGATIYASKLLGAEYPHQAFDKGDSFMVGKVKLTAQNTPGHSPDSISIFATNEEGEEYAVFTGDTLFVGDVGRPDLRENVGNIKSQRVELAKDMYKTTRDIFMTIEKDLLVYPAHGAGSLCGKGLSEDRFSTMKRELKENYALQKMSENEFLDVLLDGQPFIPKYFGYNVDLNRTGAPDYLKSLNEVPRIDKNGILEQGFLLIDTRNSKKFREKHLPNALNIPDGGKFETWLGSIVAPSEKFYLIAEDEEALEVVIQKSAKIGYELLIKGALLLPDNAKTNEKETDVEFFRTHQDAFTIIDIKNTSETFIDKPFGKSINIPLPELRERIKEIPTDKAIMVHCAGGYRSGIGSSILKAALPNLEIFDLGEAINDFKQVIA